MYIGFGSFFLGLSSNYPWMMIRGGEGKNTTSWKIPKLKEAYLELTNNYYLSYTLLDLWMGWFLFLFLHHHILSFFPWRGEKHFSIRFSLMARERRKEHNLEQTTSNLSLGARQNFVSTAQLGGGFEIKPSSDHKPPSPILVFSFFLFQFEICPLTPPHSFHNDLMGGKVCGGCKGGGGWSSLADRFSSLSTYLNLARFRNIWNWKFLPSSYSGWLACYCCWCWCSAVNEIFRIWQAVFCSCVVAARVIPKPFLVAEPRIINARKNSLLILWFWLLCVCMR